ncbi:MAG: glutamate--tRNA ligase family protein, partial [Bacteroidota bacterium]
MPARLAPTPSGYLHRGNAANFALNALLAKQTDGRLLLRIDDLDRGRFREEYLEDIFQTIAWLGLEVTDGPRDAVEFHARWSQEHRMDAYREALEQLRNHELVFACACSRRELAQGKHVHGCLEGRVDLDAPGVAWRIDTRRLGNDYLHREMPDFAIRKKDGRPSYQLAC